MRRYEENALGMFIIGTLVGAGLAAFFAPKHGGSGHKILDKLKKMLHIRRNGIAVNDSSATRRHKRA